MGHGTGVVDTRTHMQDRRQRTAQLLGLADGIKNSLEPLAAQIVDIHGIHKAMPHQGSRTTAHCYDENILLQKLTRHLHEIFILCNLYVVAAGKKTDTADSTGLDTVRLCFSLGHLF